MLKEKAIVDTLINYSLFTNGVILVFSMWYTKFRFFGRYFNGKREMVIKIWRLGR